MLMLRPIHVVRSARSTSILDFGFDFNSGFHPHFPVLYSSTAPPPPPPPPPTKHPTPHTTIITITPSLLAQLSERKNKLMEGCDCLISLPGGVRQLRHNFGTLSHTFAALYFHLYLYTTDAIILGPFLEGFPALYHTPRLCSTKR